MIEIGQPLSRASRERWSLSEGERSRPLVEAEFPSDTTLELIRSWRSQDLTDLGVTIPGGRRVDCKAVVSGASTGDEPGIRHAQFRVVHISDNQVHTQTFAAPSHEVRPIKDLPGLRHVFSQVKGIDLLDLPVPCVTRFAETIDELLVRLVHACGRRLVFTLGEVRIEERSDRTIALRKRDFVNEPRWAIGEAASLVTASIGNACITVPGPQDRPHRADCLVLADGLAARLIGAVEAVPQVFSQADADRAARDEARRRQDDAFFWEASVLNADVTVGDAVTLPEGFAFAGDELRVAARVLSYDESRIQHKLLNTLWLKPTGGLPRAHRGHETLVLVKGKIRHVHDEGRLGRLGVQLPWQRDGEHVSALHLQPTSDAYATPRPGDESVLLFQPYTYSRPIALGSLFHSDRPAPCADDQVTRWRLGDCEIRYVRERQVLFVSFGDDLTFEFSAASFLSRSDIRVQKGKFTLE